MPRSFVNVHIDCQILYETQLNSNWMIFYKLKKLNLLGRPGLHLWFQCPNRMEPRGSALIKLNALTPQIPCPMRQIDEILGQVGGATVLSKLNLKSGFHQILVAISSQDYTTFISP